MRKDLVKTSKFLSLVLRHRPETLGIELDEQGWADVGELLAAAAAKGRAIARDALDEVVFTNDKQRFAYSPDGLCIRANQGHSIAVDLELAPREPPPVLYHGTAARFLESIRRDGIRKMRRQHVHLSATGEQALRVGARHGKPVLLAVDCGGMQRAGMVFYLSRNGVWLTEQVPYEFVTELQDRVKRDPAWQDCGP